MAGYVTNTRHQGKERIVKSSGRDGATLLLGLNLFRESGGSGAGYHNAPSQTTTSYRSGRRGSEPELSGPPLTPAEQKAYLLSERTYGAGRRDAKSGFDNGNTFSTWKTEMVCDEQVHLRTPSGVPLREYHGWVIPNPARLTALGGSSLYYPPVSTTDLSWYGTRAIKETIPTNPTAGLAQFLGELREKLPRATGQALFTGKGSFPARVGDEYLNYQFGLAPMGRDLGEIAASVLDASTRIKQLQRDSGKVIRRDHSFAPEVTTTSRSVRVTSALVSGLSNSTTYWGSFFDSGSPIGQLTETISLRKKIWFKGAYSYYLQSGDNLLDQIHSYNEKANAILGTRLTPSVLWELAPWSWLGDWVGNVGDNLHNAAALSHDGLVIRYGYIMCTSVHERTVQVTGVRLRDGSTLPPITCTWTTTSKVRERATPYGFAAKPGSFTARQWAILAALGMTKGDKQLGHRT